MPNNPFGFEDEDDEGCYICDYDPEQCECGRYEEGELVEEDE